MDRHPVTSELCPPSPRLRGGHAEKAVYAKRYAIVACAHMRVARQRFLGKPPAAKVYSTPTLLLHAA